MIKPLTGKHAVPGSKMIRYSSRINIALEEGRGIEDLLERYDLTIRYQYRSGNIYSLTPAGNLSLKQLKELAESLRHQEGVRSVSLDMANDLHVPAVRKDVSR